MEEDVCWILFMGTYVFPGADASTPINWVVNQLERSGFELHRLENTGVHYARTIEMWHSNWRQNKDAVVQAYNVWWFRLWDVFLAWSTVIARQGTSSCYMMTCHKNTIIDAHSVNNAVALTPTATTGGAAAGAAEMSTGKGAPMLLSPNRAELNRTELFIGDKPVAFQQ